MHGPRRAVGWAGRLLLCAALLMGVVTMHALGHPAEHGSTRPPVGSLLDTGADGHGEHAAQVVLAVPGGFRAEDPVQDGGLDPLAVCLAVLGAWTVALLARGVLSHRPADPLPAVRARRSHAHRPGVWPGLRLLRTRFSVLRI